MARKRTPRVSASEHSRLAKLAGARIKSRHERILAAADGAPGGHWLADAPVFDYENEDPRLLREFRWHLSDALDKEDPAIWSIRRPVLDILAVPDDEENWPASELWRDHPDWMKAETLRAYFKPAIERLIEMAKDAGVDDVRPLLWLRRFLIGNGPFGADDRRRVLDLVDGLRLAVNAKSTGSPTARKGVRAHTSKLFPDGPLENTNLRDAIVHLDSRRPEGLTDLQILREFVGGDDSKAKKLAGLVRVARLRGKHNLPRR